MASVITPQAQTWRDNNETLKPVSLSSSVGMTPSTSGYAKIVTIQTDQTPWLKCSYTAEKTAQSSVQRA